MNRRNGYPIVGQKVRIGSPIGEYELSYGEHTVISVEPNPYNKIVPLSFETCCGKYIPTSAADGRWASEMRIGSWDNIEAE